MTKNIYKIVSNFSSEELSMNLSYSLYEPVLGLGIELYNMFLSHVNSDINIDGTEICKELNINASQLTIYRKKLEACALVYTYNSTNKVTGENIYIIKMIKPLDPQSFLKNYLLEPLLKKNTSKIAYELLKDRFISNVDHFSEWDTTDISANYDEVFGEDLSDIITVQDETGYKLVEAEVPILNRVDSLRNDENTLYVQDTISNPMLAKNLYFHLINDSSTDFYEFLLKNRANYVRSKDRSARMERLIIEIAGLGFSQNVINLILSYAYHVNDKNINNNYVKRIAQGLQKDEIFDFVSVEEHLYNAIKFKKVTDLDNEQERSKNEYFNLLQSQIITTKNEILETKNEQVATQQYDLSDVYDEYML